MLLYGMCTNAILKELISQRDKDWKLYQKPNKDKKQF